MTKPTATQLDLLEAIHQGRGEISVDRLAFVLEVPRLAAEEGAQSLLRLELVERDRVDGVVVYRITGAGGEALRAAGRWPL